MRRLNIVGANFRRIHYFVISAGRGNRWASLVLDAVHGTSHCFDCRASRVKDDGKHMLSAGDGSWRARLSKQGDGTVHAARPEAVESFGRLAGAPGSKKGIPGYYLRLVLKWYQECFNDSLAEADTLEGTDSIDTHNWIGMRYMATASTGPATPLPPGSSNNDFVTMHAGFPHSSSFHDGGLFTMTCMRLVDITGLHLRREALAILSGMGTGGDARLFKKHEKDKPRRRIVFHEAWIYGVEDEKLIPLLPPGRNVTRASACNHHSCRKSGDQGCHRSKRARDDKEDAEDEPPDDEDDPGNTNKEKKTQVTKKKATKTLITIVSHNIGGGFRVGFRENYPIAHSRLVYAIWKVADEVSFKSDRDPGDPRREYAGALKEKIELGRPTDAPGAGGAAAGAAAQQQAMLIDGDDEVPADDLDEDGRPGDYNSGWRGKAPWEQVARAKKEHTAASNAYQRARSMSEDSHTGSSQAGTY
jgi:hypothetical protein